MNISFLFIYQHSTTKLYGEWKLPYVFLLWLNDECFTFRDCCGTCLQVSFPLFIRPSPLKFTSIDITKVVTPNSSNLFPLGDSRAFRLARVCSEWEYIFVMNPQPFLKKAETSVVALLMPSYGISNGKRTRSEKRFPRSEINKSCKLKNVSWSLEIFQIFFEALIFISKCHSHAYLVLLVMPTKKKLLNDW